MGTNGILAAFYEAVTLGIRLLDRKSRAGCDSNWWAINRCKTRHGALLALHQPWAAHGSSLDRAPLLLHCI